MIMVVKQYKLYKHRYSIKWKVVYEGQECFHPEYFHLYDVRHLDDGRVLYEEYPIPPVGH